MLLGTVRYQIKGPFSQKMGDLLDSSGLWMQPILNFF